jgi:hypothetical protein
MMVLSIRERYAIFLQIWTSSQLLCYLYELTNIHGLARLSMSLLINIHHRCPTETQLSA